MAHENESMIPVSEQAAHWWVLFREGNVSPAERREFGEWIVRSPERVEAYLRVARLQAALSRAEVRWPEIPADVLIRESIASRKDPVPLRRAWFSRDGGAVAGETGKPRPALRIAFGLAASVVVAALVGWLALSRPQQFQTKFGEQRSVLLADGSRVTLNTSSAIEVRLQAHRRSIRLVRGEALFEVAHDPGRPFEVQTAAAMLRAVGTRFNVDNRLDRTVVTVVEGRVAVLGPDNGSAVSRTPVLGVADRLVIGKAGPGVAEHGVDVSSVTAWTQRQLVFERRPLGEVAEEFNRYNLARIEIRSPLLRAEQVTGTFRSNDPASLVSFIAGIPGSVIAEDGKGGYIITLKSAESEDR